MIRRVHVAIAMTAEDWETKYKEIWERYQQERKKSTVLKERMVSK